MAKKLKDPNFVDQLKGLGMSDRSINDISFTYADHQFFVRLMGTRDEATKAELKEYLEQIYVSNNELIFKNVSEIIVAQNEKMFKFFGEIEKTIGMIAVDIKGIKTDISDIKKRLYEIECKVENDESRIKKIEGRLDKINNLEKAANIVETFDGRLIKIEKHTRPIVTVIRAVIIGGIIATVFTWLHRLGIL